jgi:arsenate reductase
MNAMLRVLILSPGAGSRVQMATALLRWFSGAAASVESACTGSVEVDPLTVQVLAERGLEPDVAAPTPVASLGDAPFDYVIALYDPEFEVCPGWPARTAELCWRVPDPGVVDADWRQRAEAFRRCRDELEERLVAWWQTVGAQS